MLMKAAMRIRSTMRCPFRADSSFLMRTWGSPALRDHPRLAWCTPLAWCAYWNSARFRLWQTFAIVWQNLATLWQALTIRFDHW